MASKSLPGTVPTSPTPAAASPGDEGSSGTVASWRLLRRVESHPQPRPPLASVSDSPRKDFTITHQHCCDSADQPKITKIVCWRYLQLVRQEVVCVLVHARHRNREKLHHALIAHCSGRHRGVKRVRQFRDAISISRPENAPEVGALRLFQPRTDLRRKLLRKLCNPRINSSFFFSSPPSHHRQQSPTPSE